MRFSTSNICSAPCFVRRMRSKVWQLMHSISGRFCSVVPGMLMNHSVLLS